MEFGNLNLHLGNFFRPACCRFDLTLGNLLHSCLRPFGKTKNSLLFSPGVEKCKKRPHLFFLLRFGFNRDPFFVPNSNRSSLNPPKTNPMKATLLKARPSKANPLRANSFKADPLNPLKVSPSKADPLQANPLKPNLSKAKMMMVNSPKLSLCRLSVQRPIL